jgi:glycosyltransferase involved in cell wall biosynthesis
MTMRAAGARSDVLDPTHGEIADESVTGTRSPSGEPFSGDRPLRVVMLTQFYAPTLGGEERVIEDLSVELRRRGHDVAVATLHHPGLERFELRDGVRVHRLNSSLHRAPWLFAEDARRHAPPFPDPETVADLRRILDDERPDIVHAHNWLVYSFLPLRKRSKAGLLFSLHDHSLYCATKRLFRNGRPCSGPGIAKCAACAASHYGVAKGVGTAAANGLMAKVGRRKVDLFLPVSNRVATLTGLGSSDRYRVVPNFIRAERVEHRPSDLRGLERLPEGDFILFVGDATADKGIEILIEAYRRLRDSPPLVIIGRRYLDELLGATPGVVALGPLPHELVMEAWRRCSIAVVPSIWEEPFGLAALEASASGKPVIASRIGGLPDVVVNEETGLLCPPGDPGALQRSLERLLAEPELRRRMGEAGRRRSELFMPDVVVPQIEGAYRSVLAGRARGRP